jgi:hypothetical protein
VTQNDRAPGDGRVVDQSAAPVVSLLAGSPAASAKPLPACSASLPLSCDAAAQLVSPMALPLAAPGDFGNLLGEFIGIFISNGDEPGENGGLLFGNGGRGGDGL